MPRALADANIFVAVSDFRHVASWILSHANAVLDDISAGKNANDVCCRGLQGFTIRSQPHFSLNGVILPVRH